MSKVSMLLGFVLGAGCVSESPIGSSGPAGGPLAQLEPSPSPSPSSSVDLSGGGGGGGGLDGENAIIDTSERFYPITQGAPKKIDLLLVVDNSTSMSTEQYNVRDGFSAVADRYFGNPNFDICVGVVTTNRYLGATGRVINGVPYAREKIIGCTSTLGSADTIAQFKSYMNGIGAGTDSNYTCELAGKSAVTFLTHSSTWSDVHKDTLTQNALHPFFRADSLVNVSFMTDENNWGNAKNCAGSATLSEVEDDIPPVQGALRPGTTTADNRPGIVNYLDNAFSRLVSGERKFNVLSFLSLDGSGNPLRTNNAQGLPSGGGNKGALNLWALPGLIENHSENAQITSGTAYYESRYESMMQELVSRAASLRLSFPIATTGSIEVRWIKLNGTEQVLASGTDYTISPDLQEIRISAPILNTMQVGEAVDIYYAHRE